MGPSGRVLDGQQLAGHGAVRDHELEGLGLPPEPYVDLHERNGYALCGHG